MEDFERLFLTKIEDEIKNKKLQLKQLIEKKAKRNIKDQIFPLFLNLQPNFWQVLITNVEKQANNFEKMNDNFYKKGFHSSESQIEDSNERLKNEIENIVDEMLREKISDLQTHLFANFRDNFNNEIKETQKGKIKMARNWK